MAGQNHQGTTLYNIMILSCHDSVSLGCGWPRWEIFGLGRSPRMYYMDHLLTLLTIEKARELQFRAGSPPVIVLEDEQHSLQGPPITGEDVMRLLRSMATSRQMRDLREHGGVQFIYTLPDRSPFLVRATMEDENVVFDVS